MLNSLSPEEVSYSGKQNFTKKKKPMEKSRKTVETLHNDHGPRLR